MRHLVLMGGALLSLLAVTLLAGNTGPMCTPADPGQPVCLTAKDCEGQIHPECVGEWACVDATCDWQCGIGPIGCHSDEACPTGMHCSVSDGDCGTDPSCPMCDVCYGECVPDQPPPVDCESDDDCAPGERCLVTEMCWDGICEDGLPCGGCERHGECVPDQPPPPECAQDSDCPQGFFCALTDCACPAGADCDCAPFGVCLPIEQPLRCDADGDCPPGMICEATGFCPPCDDGAPCPGMPCVIEGVCVPGPQPECGSDADCPAGMRCEYLPCACETDPSIDCVCEAFGVCVPDPQPECFSDADCKPGFHCEALYKCDPATNCDDAGNCYDDKCIGSPGVCVPDPDPLCLTNADCGPGERCTALEECIILDCLSLECSYCHGHCVPDKPVCYSDWDCDLSKEFCQRDIFGPDGQMLCCPADMDMPCYMNLPLCEGVCVPKPEPLCTDDADCGPGAYCDFYELSPNGGCCMPGEVCLAIYMPCQGVCKPFEQPGCFADSECGIGEFCAFDDATCPPPPDCPPGAYCASPPCGGTCQLKPGLCWDDADCKAGQTCEGAQICPPNAYCFAADKPGECVAKDTKCRRTGCSGQFCLPFDVASTCEWLPEYACYQLTECVELPNGTCGWAPNDAFESCLAQP